MVALFQLTLCIGTVAESAHHNAVLGFQFGGIQTAQLGGVQDRTLGLHEGIQQVLLLGCQGIRHVLLHFSHGIQGGLVTGFLGRHAFHTHLVQLLGSGTSRQGTNKITAAYKRNQRQNYNEVPFHNLILHNPQIYAFFKKKAKYK